MGQGGWPSPDTQLHKKKFDLFSDTPQGQQKTLLDWTELTYRGMMNLLNSTGRCISSLSQQPLIRSVFARVTEISRSCEMS